MEVINKRIAEIDRLKDITDPSAYKYALANLKGLKKDFNITE